MTYAWQKNKTMTAPLLEGETVLLNPQWTGYDYLRKEYGDLFPCGIEAINGDRITVSRKKLDFARQCLTTPRLQQAT